VRQPSARKDQVERMGTENSFVFKACTNNHGCKERFLPCQCVGAPRLAHTSHTVAYRQRRLTTTPFTEQTNGMASEDNGMCGHTTAQKIPPKKQSPPQKMVASTTLPPCEGRQRGRAASILPPRQLQRSAHPGRARRRDHQANSTQRILTSHLSILAVQ